MKSHEITIDEVVVALKVEYEKAKKASYVAKPLSYALHSVWRTTDKVEKRRKLPHKEG